MIVLKPETCARCSQPLKPKTEVWLEYDQVTDTYTDAGDIPPKASLGLFPFGEACAKAARKERMRVGQNYRRSPDTHYQLRSFIPAACGNTTGPGNSERVNVTCPACLANADAYEKQQPTKKKKPTSSR